MSEMTEQQIRDGYERLDSALAPPMDATERVARRVRVRRRHRRTAVASAAVLTIGVAAGGAAILAGGNDGSEGLAVDQPSGPASTLVMTRPDGSTYAFPDMTVSCKAPDPGGDSGSAQRIWALSPRHIEGETITEPFVLVEGIVSRLQGDRTLDLPIDGPGDSTTYPLTVFIADTEGAPDGNEVSSGAGGSGTVRVLEATCDPVPVLRLEIDATIGSEEGKQSLDLAGRLD
jgi:hypothetical protein